MHLLSFDKDCRFSLTAPVGKDIPEYAILSHTWGEDAEEVTFRDIVDGTGEEKEGYRKLYFCGKQAQRDQLHYFWVDTCCIDKTSSSELQEAITSMFRWYQQAAKCYVYLSDLQVDGHSAVDSTPHSWQSAFRRNRWFTRGWTLQELLAPRSVEFFDSNSQLLGDKKSLEQQIYEITGIPVSALQGTPLSEYSAEERMSWAKNRRTKREEDKAYSLLGIFDIYMPLMYGETAENAFRRLEEEIDKGWRKHRLIEPSSESLMYNVNKRFKNQSYHAQLLQSRKEEKTSQSEAPLRFKTSTHGESSTIFLEEVPTDIETPTNDALVAQLYFKKIDDRLTTMAAAQGKTCRWFFTRPAYISWQDSAQYETHGGFLWIKGNPGTGKSTLMKLLFEEVNKSTRDDASQIIISFFFLARGTDLEKSTTGLYRSLLHQLFEKQPQLKTSIEWMTINGARGIQQDGWHEEALKRTLLEAVQELGSSSLTIFIDALDECDQDQAANMISYLEELCERAQTAQVQLQICLSSRYYPTIFVEKSIEVELEDEVGHIEDIRQYIKSKLKIGTSNQAELLKAEVLEKSCGIFLWVVLVLDIINQEYSNKNMSIKKIQGRLKELPGKLNELFEMIVTRDGENTEQLQICLKWILFAVRPLKPKELHFAIELTLDQTHSGLWDPQELEYDKIAISIRNSSKGLAEITRSKDPIVQLIHESVRDFLLGRYKTQWSGPSGGSIGYSHENLKTCCFTQISAQIQELVDLQDPLPRTSQMVELRQTIGTRFPFLEYAVVNILRHANSAQNSGINQELFLVNFPTEKWRLLNNAIETADVRRYTASVSLLYVLAEKNLGDLIHISPRRAFCFDIENERYGLPLFAALAMGSWDAVQAFIDVQSSLQPENQRLSDLSKQFTDRGSEHKEFGRTFKFSRQKSITHHVLDQGDGVILKFICASGQLDLEDTRNPNHTPLQHAIEIKHVEQTKIILQHYECVDSDKLNGSLLLHGAKVGFCELVQLLLDYGISIDTTDSTGRAALSYAAERGNQKMVLLLLENGALVNWQDHTGKTALMYAAVAGYEIVVRILLERKAGVNMKAKDSKTSLLYAWQGGHENIVLMLLEFGAQANMVDDHGKTLLMCAAESNSQLIVERLLAGGAGVSVTHTNVASTLVSAACNGHTALVEMILVRGFDKDARDEIGRTALSCAAINEHKIVVKQLLRHSADMESSDNGGRTPLSHAVKGSYEVVKLLIDQHADVGSRDDDGRTPLSHCIMTGPLQDYQKQLMLLEQQNKKYLMMARREHENTMSTHLVPSTLPPMAASYRKAPQPGAQSVGLDTLWEHHVKIIALLLEKGAQLESKDKWGWTPLFHQVNAGFVRGAKLLLEKGAKIDCEDNNGMTPISYAQAQRDDEMVELLLN